MVARPLLIVLSWPVSQITERRTSPRRRWLLRTRRASAASPDQCELKPFALLEDTSSFAVRQELALFQIGEGAAAQRVEDVGLGGHCSRG